ncbi:MAG: aspartate/glutamate racemase family protein [bacterium]|nr:aspartate/glutamate racemase family protein [bacterium]
MIGVLGGMGPMATADFLTKLIGATPAKRDRDHIPVIVQSLPQIPDRTKAILEDGPSPLPDMISMTKKLKTAGADYGVIACNTAHHWYDNLVSATGLEFLHIADAVCIELKKRNTRPDGLGLMATPGTIGSGFYQDRLAKAGFSCHIPDSCAIERIYEGIEAIKANNLTKGHEILFKEASSFQRHRVKTVILGCTELPIILNDTSCFIDANLALANACVARSLPNYPSQSVRAA